MMLHISTTNLILVGVFAHLLLSLSKLVFKAPKQQAQIDRLDSKVDGAVSTVQQILPVVQTINRKTFTNPVTALVAGEELTQALLPLPLRQDAASVRQDAASVGSNLMSSKAASGASNASGGV